MGRFEELADLVEGAAMMRKDPPIPREFIDQALRKIDAKEIKVERYPSGEPSLKAVYDVALGLESAYAPKH